MLGAFRFLSILPLPRGKVEDESNLAPAVAWFPLVGCALGGLLIFTDWVCGEAFPKTLHLLTAALILVVYALFTRGLHYDGLMDVADAFLGRRSREERLRIMKDSHVGAMGVTVIILLLVVELSAIYALPVHVVGSSGRFRWAALLVFPVLGRWVMAYLCVRFPYARAEGTAAPMVRESRLRHLALATALAVAALVGSFVFLVNIPLLIAVLFVFSLAFAELLGRIFSRSLGGITGDVIGAVGMLSECLILIILASRLPGVLIL